MAVVLGALVFCVLVGGLTLLALVPLMFAWLGVAVVTEPWDRGTRAATPEGDALPASDATAEAAESERRRVMVAGRRRPL